MSLASHAPGDDRVPGQTAPRRPAVSSAPQARVSAWRAYTVVWRDGAACSRRRTWTYRTAVRPRR